MHICNVTLKNILNLFSCSEGSQLSHIFIPIFTLYNTTCMGVIFTPVVCMGERQVYIYINWQLTTHVHPLWASTCHVLQHNPPSSSLCHPLCQAPHLKIQGCMDIRPQSERIQQAGQCSTQDLPPQLVSWHSSLPAEHGAPCAGC